jgi:hypothetical protein
VNFQVTVLKVLVSYPDGFAAMEDLKRDMAILATSGLDWAERTKRLAARVPDLDIFSQGLIERVNGGWRVTDKGRSVLEIMGGAACTRPSNGAASRPRGRGADAGHDSVTNAFDNASSAQAGTKAAPTRRCTAKTSELVVRNVLWG